MLYAVQFAVLDEKSDLMARSAPRIPRAGKIDDVFLKQRDDLTVHTKSVFPSATAEATLYAFGDGRQHRGFALTFPLLTAISRRRGG